MNEHGDTLTDADKALLRALLMPSQDDSDDLPLEPEDGETGVVVVPTRPSWLPDEPPSASES